MSNSKEYMKQYKKQYRIDNKEEIRKAKKKYYLDNIEKVKDYNHSYYLNNKEKAKEMAKQYRKNNPERIKRWNEQYCQKNKKKWNKYLKNKRNTDIKYNLRCRISIAMGDSLKGNKNGRKWERLVGYNVNNLMKHLKKTIPKGYTWQGYLEGRLHIDHIIPISAFNFSKPEHIDFKRCWALKNLQLLPARENLIKHNKLPRPFQPALKILI